jgi:hypothetical protein
MTNMLDLHVIIRGFILCLLPLTSYPLPAVQPPIASRLLPITPYPLFFVLFPLEGGNTRGVNDRNHWIPACAGMTNILDLHVIIRDFILCPLPLTSYPLPAVQPPIASRLLPITPYPLFFVLSPLEGGNTRGVHDRRDWIPACAGMTGWGMHTGPCARRGIRRYDRRERRHGFVIPAKAGIQPPTRHSGEGWNPATYPSFRRKPESSHLLVIPAKAGIQWFSNVLSGYILTGTPPV